MHPSLPALQVQQSTLRLLFMLLRFRGSIGLRDPTMSGQKWQNAFNLLREWAPATPLYRPFRGPFGAVQHW